MISTVFFDQIIIQSRMHLLGYFSIGFLILLWENKNNLLTLENPPFNSLIINWQLIIYLLYT